MKKLALLLLGFVLAGTMSAQDLISNFQKKHEKEAGFTIVNITPKMFEMISMMSDDEEMEFIKNLSGLKVLTTSKTPDKYFEDATQMLLSSDHEELMSVVEDRESVLMYIKEKNKGVISSLIITVSEPTEFTMVSITGDIDLKKISTLSNTLNIEKLQKMSAVE